MSASDTASLKKTPLHGRHLAAGAKMVDFSGWSMPIHYGSQVKEHEIVRTACGLFDVSHMGIIDLAGKEVLPFLETLLCSDINRLDYDGSAFYTLLLDDDGHILDDLIVYRMEAGWYRLVVNASRREHDLAWIGDHSQPFDCHIRFRDDLAMVAIQGPESIEKLGSALSSCSRDCLLALKPFQTWREGERLLARTGYTGEEGFELIAPINEIGILWDMLVSKGIEPIGLGARDTLRLEAGLHLYGSDMDATTTPLETGLAWVVHWEPEGRSFVGRSALEAVKRAGEVGEKRVGLILQGRGVLRDGQSVMLDGQKVGIITSGSFSPSIKKGIALARVVRSIAIGDVIQVDVRGKMLDVQVVKPSFVRHGKEVWR
ncbi:MAG: glycine cleavage system aminomethyltransferase GcvT [Magnetococcales bacterium]|nr:glycine cleavage system aminomethyltransferase GcvT [Magnetococcales bacterium]